MKQGETEVLMAWTRALATNKAQRQDIAQSELLPGWVCGVTETPIWGATEREEDQGSVVGICHCSACSVSESPSSTQRSDHCVSFLERMLIVVTPGSWDTIGCFCWGL